MAKKGNQQTKLSPENYIRTKARTLPIHECMVNHAWEEARMANVMIARKHTNGNITGCNFLVDLMALGIKGSSYFFNMDIVEYNEVVASWKNEHGFITIPYALAHNIILAAEEYSEDLGFQQCKLYRNTTKYMLDEDTDDIELIEIECGVNGKPMLALTDNMDVMTIRSYHETLKKSVGEDGYTFIENWGDFDASRSYADDEQFFLDNIDRVFNMPEDERGHFFEIAAELIDEYKSSDKIEVIKGKIDFIKNLKVNRREVSPEFLGLKPDDELPSETAVEYFCDVLGAVIAEESVISRAERLSKLLPGHPATTLATLFANLKTEDFDFNGFAAKGVKDFPDYGLLQMFNDTYVADNLLAISKKNDGVLDFKKYFGDRTEFNQLELFHYFQSSSILAGSFDDLEYLMAILDSIPELSIDEDLMMILNRFVVEVVFNSLRNILLS